MGVFFKELANHEDILYLFAAIVVILVIFLVVYVLSIIKYPEDDKRSSYSRNRRTSNNRYADYEPYKNQKQSGRERASNNQVASSDQVFNNKKESDYTNQFNDDEWREYAKNEAEKRKRNQAKKNENETEDCVIESDHRNDDPVSVPTLIKYDYLEAANSGQFRKLLPSDEKCFFRTWMENGVRKFEFHGNVDKALANINAIFDDVCEIEGKQNGATQIDNLDPGILDSQLKVEKPAKIKLT